MNILVVLLLALGGLVNGGIIVLAWMQMRKVRPVPLLAVAAVLLTAGFYGVSSPSLTIEGARVVLAGVALLLITAGMKSLPTAVETSDASSGATQKRGQTPPKR